MGSRLSGSNASAAFPVLQALLRIMGKRVASATHSSVSKKVKVNPVFAEIQDALKKAEELPANCRAMLAAMVPASFASLKEERTEQQATIIQWMEEVLGQQKTKLVEEVDAVAAKLAELEAGKAVHVGELQKAEVVVVQKKEQHALKRNDLAETTIVLSTTKKLLAEQQEEQRVCDSDFLAMKKEQEGLASAFVEHFKAPLEAGEALHYSELQPFLRNLDLEESFMISVPSSCCKTKEQRGSFDNVVLEALEQALLERASQIKDVVSNRSPESHAREAAVQKSEEQLVVDRTAQERATAELAAAQKDVDTASAAFKAIEQVIANCDVDIKATSELSEKHRLLNDAFEQGALASFRNSRDGTVASVCATAGA